MLGRFRDFSSGCCHSTTSGIRASQVSLGIFLEIRRASGSDSVIVCRSQKDARSAQGIFGGVDPVRNSIYGFKKKVKKIQFLSKL